MKKNMNKSTVVHKNSSYHRAADVPEVIDMDSLSYYDDDGLERRHNQLQSEREKPLAEATSLLRGRLKSAMFRER